MEATKGYRRQCVCNGSKDELYQHTMNLLLDMSSLMLLGIMNYVTGLYSYSFDIVPFLTLFVWQHIIYFTLEINYFSENELPFGIVI